MNEFPADTSAAAVVLNEFAEAYVDNERDHNLIFEYHTVIKILKTDGVKEADVEIDLRRDGHRVEVVRTTKASSYNLENGAMKETPMDPKSVRSVKVNDYWDQVKFAIPNVRVGSVVEIFYVTESPFFFNFKPWEFQSHIPKMKSEFWATIPGNYVYNITFKGYLPLSKNESGLVKECFTPGGGDRADCSRYKWAMDNVPAFPTEEYMTARSNYIAQINFELSEIVYFDGRKDKFTKEWKDAEEELRASDRFGQQLRRGKSIVDGPIDALLANEVDPLVKAQKIYAFMQDWYSWDEMYGKYSELGIKKAFDQRKGNVGDINLSLVAALRYAGIDANPLVLSTRNNGLPIELHPVLSDFNYVIARVKIGDKDYLLDATDDFLPFGTIPERCLNGKGRLIEDRSSQWYELKSATKYKKRSTLNMKLGTDGIVRGSWSRVYTGYDAVDTRKAIAAAGSKENYFKELKSAHPAIDFTGFEIDNPADLAKPVIVSLQLEWSCYDQPEVQNFLFNPFPFDRVKQNPFRSPERLFPVDFGASLERTTVLMLEYPQQYQPAELPAAVAIGLPNGAGRYVCEFKKEENKITVLTTLAISKPVFSAQEYHYLKELYAQIVANQQAELLFKKKL